MTQCESEVPGLVDLVSGKLPAPTLPLSDRLMAAFHIVSKWQKEDVNSRELLEGARPHNLIPPPQRSCNRTVGGRITKWI